MSGTEQTAAGAGGGGLPELTAATVVLFVGVVGSFVLFVLVFFLYLRAKRYWGAIPGHAVPAPPAAAAAAPRGLDASGVAALPSFAFHGSEESAECAVCLCELAEGEAARLLPRCGHAFHLECIDKWFSSRSTCPLCRGAVVAAGDDPETGALSAAPREESSPPEISASPPLSAAEEGSSSSGFEVEAPPSSPLAASVLAEEETAVRPPLPQQAAALRSLRRLLARVGGGDVEQGNAREWKAPTSS